jgi:Restriction endonuclease
MDNLSSRHSATTEIAIPETSEAHAKGWKVLLPNSADGDRAAFSTLDLSKAFIVSRVAHPTQESSVAADAWTRALHRREHPAAGPALMALREAALTTPASERVTKLIERRRRDLRVGDEDMIAKSVESLTAVGYRDMIGDLFRGEGYAVLACDGPDADVIDLEVARGHKRWFINCQLRGVALIDMAPVIEMAKVVRQNKAAGAFIIADGAFVPEANTFARENKLVLISGMVLMSMIVELALEDARGAPLGGRMARRLHPWRGHEVRHAALTPAERKL